MVKTMISKYKKWAEEKMKMMDLWDMKLIKWSVAAFTLMLAKLWPPILSLDWYWYGVIGLLLIARTVNRLYM